MTKQTVYRIPVPSQSDPDLTYIVSVYRDGATGQWVGNCDHRCRGHHYRGKCAHLAAALLVAREADEADLALIHVPEAVDPDPFAGLIESEAAAR